MTTLYIITAFVWGVFTMIKQYQLYEDSYIKCFFVGLLNTIICPLSIIMASVRSIQVDEDELDYVYIADIEDEYVESVAIRAKNFNDALDVLEEEDVIYELRPHSYRILNNKL